MNRREPPSGRDLPGADSPSDEVLDELLRAFSADETDQDVLRRIDLTSPEIEELLAAPDAEPESRAELRPETQPQTRAAEPDQSVPAAEEVDDVRVIQPAEVPDVEVGHDAEEVDHVRVIEPVDDVDAAGADEEVDDVAVADGHSTPGGVAGDPFLGAGPTTGDDSGDDTSGGGRKTISIVDGELPDSVYLEGGLGSGGSPRSTVFIDDRGDSTASTTISMEDATSATKIEPRLRERRIAVKRAIGRKRLKWALAVSLVVAIVVAALAVLGSGLFAIDEVAVEGAENTDEAALAAVVADLEGTPVLLADTDAAERELEKIAWVDAARVTTDFPNRATIEISERVPVVAYQAPDEQWRVLDGDGRVLLVVEEQPVDYEVVTGPQLLDLELGQWAQPGFGDAAMLVGALPPAVAAQTENVIVTPDGTDLRLTLADGTEVRFGAAQDLVQKLVRLQAKLNELEGRPVNYIDVSTNEVGTG